MTEVFRPRRLFEFAARGAVAWAARDRAVVLVFHSVPEEGLDSESGLAYGEAFARLLDRLMQMFTFISLGELIHRLDQGKPVGRTAVMTFDDGYPDWPTVIAPVLKSRGLPATFFVTTSQLRGQPMWSERIATLLRKGRPTALQSLHPAIPPVDWSNALTREAAVEPVTACLKYLRLPFRDALIDRMEHACQTRLEEVPIFRPEHLRTLHDLGFDIGAHTVDHPILTYCTESEARLEISRARDDLSALVGTEIRHFAYPNGKPMADYSARDIALIKQCGYAGAVTTAQGSLRLGCSPYQIPRFAPWGQAAWQPVRQLLSNLRRDGEQLVEA